MFNIHYTLFVAYSPLPRKWILDVTAMRIRQIFNILIRFYDFFFSTF